MNYDINPIPTIYKGRKFRSRLEARWQSFFDSVGWAVEYEPCQINGYNPDFIIKCESKCYNTNYIIVEVKPAIFVDDKFKSDFLEKYKNISAHLLILTDFPFTKSDKMSYGNVVLGEGRQWYADEDSKHIELDEFTMKCDNDFASSILIFDGMIYGKIDRKQFMEYGTYDYLGLCKKWTETGNKTQFKIS